uniref:Anti-proliferative protein domain-containing protein n=1 Tax=Trichogramma kaykai TaxID=54128 RepID=A0ABD2X4J2_9HYME
MDPVVVEAGSIAGIEINDLRTIYPTELTIWIDPSHVSYRIGENGSTCVLFDGVSEKSDYVDNSKPKNIQVVKNEKVSTANECDSSLRSSPKIDLEKLNTSQERHDNTSPTKLNASSPPFHPSPRANSTTKKAEYIARPVPTVSSRPYFFTYVNGEMVHFTPSVRISSQPSTPQYGCGAMDILSSDINNINIHCNNNTYVSS